MHNTKEHNLIYFQNIIMVFIPIRNIMSERQKRIPAAMA